MTSRYKPKRSSKQIIKSLKAIYIALRKKKKQLKITYGVQQSKLGYKPKMQSKNTNFKSFMLEKKIYKNICHLLSGHPLAYRSIF